MRCIGDICRWAKRGECTSVYVPDRYNPKAVILNRNYGKPIARITLNFHEPLCTERLSVKDRAEKTR